MPTERTTPRPKGREIFVDRRGRPDCLVQYFSARQDLCCSLREWSPWRPRLVESTLLHRLPVVVLYQEWMVVLRPVFDRRSKRPYSRLVGPNYLPFCNKMSIFGTSKTPFWNYGN